jgi:hypothetical protein
MRAKRVRALRTDQRPHPGRKHGGSFGRNDKRTFNDRVREIANKLVPDPVPQAPSAPDKEVNDG